MQQGQDIELPIANGALLRPFVVADAELTYGFEFDPGVKKYLWLPDKDKVEWMKAFTSQARTGTYRASAIVALPESVLAGRASINRSLNDPHSRELQIIVAKPFWGRGLGRIVADMLIRCAFTELGAKVVTATVHPDNAASLNLLKAFKFVPVGVESEGKQVGHLLYELRAEA